MEIELGDDLDLDYGLKCWLRMD